jgi:hypothetical protein
VNAGERRRPRAAYRRSPIRISTALAVRASNVRTEPPRTVRFERLDLLDSLIAPRV